MKQLLNLFKQLMLRPGRSLAGLIVMLAVVCVILVVAAPVTWWQTRDQQAQVLFDNGDFIGAARLFSSPQRRGIALYRAADFPAAANEFARVNSDTGHFNRGNALLMAGKYDEASDAFESALALHPDWPEAIGNLAIARLRASRTAQVGGDMTGGMLGADDFVFDNNKSESDGAGEEQVDGGQTMSDRELQALWLRRVQTNPGDFLRIKFAFQSAVKGQGGEQP